MTNNLFINRLLNLKKIKMIGLDMDHTLIRYHTANFESLVYQLTVEKLIDVLGYPKAIRQFKFNFNNAIRGLVVDSRNGNILKLSRFAGIRQSYHGTKPISYKEQQEIYRSYYVDLGDHNFIAVDTSFSIAFCVLYGQLVDYKDEHPQRLPDYETITNDVRNMVDRIHADGSLKATIGKNLSTYVVQDESLVIALKRYLKHGKKLFILTNSDYHYTKMLLDFAINPYLEHGETWQDLFEYVITLASKPRFFIDNLNFLKVDSKSGEMVNLSGPLLPGIYQGGCADIFTKETGFSGDEILYIGDHIYGDILRLKKDCNWRTALVVEELGAEVQARQQAMSIEQNISALMEEKITLEERSLAVFSKLKRDPNDELERQHHSLTAQIHDIDDELAKLIELYEGHFNMRWGSVFRTGAEESFFANQVERFACIYMEKITDLLDHSPLTYFRAGKRLMPHEL